MEFKDMSKVKKQLMLALMLGKAFEEDRGMLVTKEVKLIIEEEERHYDGPEIRIKKGNIIAFGMTKDDVEQFEVIEINIDEKEAHLKKVEIFKAGVTDGQGHSNEVCVVGNDRKDAFKKLREYCKENGYRRIMSVEPSEIFKPLVK